MSFERRVIRTADVAEDLQLHVSILTVDDERVVDVRNFIVSSQTYGRGVVFPLNQVRFVREALLEISRTEPK